MELTHLGSEASMYLYRLIEPDKKTRKFELWFIFVDKTFVMVNFDQNSLSSAKKK